MTLSHVLAPVTSHERINSLDVLRGVALFGILLMNITGFGLIFQAYSDPTVMGGATGWDLRVWIMTNMFFEGTMRAMFSMLFGVGMVLMTSRMEVRGGGIEVADIYYRRTLWLFLFGIIHGYLLLWPGEILFAYGLFGLFLFPFRKTSAKRLIIYAGILILFGFGLQLYQYDKAMKSYDKFQQAQKLSASAITPELKEGKEQWEKMVNEAKPKEEEKKRTVEGMQKGYFDVVLFLAPINRMVQTVFNYDYNPWDVLPMMLLGIALYKLKVITAALSYRAYFVMLVVGYGLGFAFNYREVTMIIQDNFSVYSQLTANLTYPFGRIAVAFGHIAVVMLFCKSNILVFLKKGLAAVGKMALTNYIMHSIICGLIFTGVGFGMFGQMQRHELYYIVASIWLFQLIASPIWLTYFRFGPLEWLWRSLTYKTWQPFRISAPVVQPDIVQA